MSDLLSALVSKPQREISGSDTASRFDFQKNWALCEMIGRHSDEKDYMVAFEYHDDVLFFDSEDSPTTVEFIQVKTSKSSSPRKLSSITYRRKDANSILGKLILNSVALKFPFPMKMILISNSVYEFSENNICANDLENKHRNKLLEKVKGEFPDASEDILKSIHFHVISLPVSDIETFLRGKAVDLFEKRFGHDFTHNVISWLRLIQGEIIRKNNFPSDQIATVKDLKEQKCFGKNFIAESLNAVENRHRPAPNVSRLVDRLISEGWTTVRTTKIEKSIPLAAADYKDPTNIACKSLCREIQQCVEEVDYNDMELGTLLNHVSATLSSAGTVPVPYSEENYMNALTLLIFHDTI